MAEVTTLVGGVELVGRIPANEALARRRRHFEAMRDRAVRELAQPDAEVEITYWRGSTQIEPPFPGGALPCAGPEGA